MRFNRYDPDRQVLRVEFEVGRKGLVEYGVDTPEDGLERAAGMWCGLTREWMRFVVESGDGNRSRWPSDPAWQIVQGASLGGGALGLERVREGKKAGSLRLLTPGLVGYTASMAALVGTVDVDDSAAALVRVIRDDEIIRHIPFAERIAAKVAEGRYS